MFSEENPLYTAKGAIYCKARDGFWSGGSRGSGNSRGGGRLWIFFGEEGGGFGRGNMFWGGVCVCRIQWEREEEKRKRAQRR